MKNKINKFKDWYNQSEDLEVTEHYYPNRKTFEKVLMVVFASATVFMTIFFWSYISLDSPSSFQTMLKSFVVLSWFGLLLAFFIVNDMNKIVTHSTSNISLKEDQE